MKNSGKSSQLAVRLILWSFLAFVAIVAVGYLAMIIGAFIRNAALVLFAFWGLLAVGIYFYFRDPDPVVPIKEGVLVSPTGGRVESIEQNVSAAWLEGEFQKIVIRSRVFDMPTQYAPVSGAVTQHIYKPGDWQGSTDASRETLSVEFESGECVGERLAVQLVAGKIGRRIISWITQGEEVERGQRTGLMQLGMRCEVFLPSNCEIRVRVDSQVKGGETVLAERTNL